MWPQRVELGFTDKTPTAGKIEGAFPSGSRGYPIRSKFRVTEGQNAEVQRHLEGTTVEAGTALRGFLAQATAGTGSGVRRPGLQSELRNMLNCIFLGRSLRHSKLQFPAVQTGDTNRGNQPRCHETQQRRARSLCRPGKAMWLVPTLDCTSA